MIVEEDIKILKEVVGDFLSKMTLDGFDLDINYSIIEAKDDRPSNDLIELNITMQDPKFLIGQNGKTLIDLERILRVVLNKKLQKNFYLKLDINNYQKKKIEYLKNLAKDSADEVSLTKRNKILPPMSPYERRIIHIELESRNDVLAESQGDGLNKHIIISPK